MRYHSWISLVCTVLCLGTLFLQSSGHGKSNKPSDTQSVYERIMQTQTIRCGYGQWPPFISQDINTKQFSGIFYYYMESLGASLNLKIEWTEELGTGDFATALKSHRIDAMCGSIWQNAARAREMDFIRPIYFTPIYAYARADETKFDNNLSAINAPKVKIITMDGEMAGLIANSDFPKAKTINLPQLSSVSEFFVNIAMKKADVTFATPSMFNLYTAHNPNMMKRISSPHPVRIFGNSIAITTGEDKLRQMLNTATEELLANGTITKILKKYGSETVGFLEVSLPYKE